MGTKTMAWRPSSPSPRPGDPADIPPSRPRRVVPLFLLPVTQLLVIPSYLAFSNDTSILALSPTSLAVLVLASAACTCLLWAIYLGLRRLSGGRIRLDVVYLLLARFLLFFIVLAGFVFPVSRLTGLTDPASAPINGGNLLLCFLLSSVLLVASESKPGKVLDQAVVAYLCVNVLLVIASAIQTETSPHQGTFGPASESHNIFVLSFDGLSRQAMLTALANDPSLREVLQGFTVFERAATSSPATSASIAAELYGNQNFKLDYSTTQEVWDSDPSRLLTNVLAAEGYRVTTYGVYGTNLMNEQHRVESSKFESSGHLLVTGALARTLTSAIVPERTLAELERATLLGRDSDLEWQSRIAQSHGPDWSRNLVFSVADYETFASDLRVEGSEPSAFFLHFTHTHFPIQFDGTCTFRADDDTWLATHQTHEADVELSRCALSQLKRFLVRLEDLGILEHSMIVFKSDHGKPVSYAPTESIEAVAINHHPSWGISRYAPFLAVRPFGAGSEPMRKAQSPALTDDLARTLCEESELSFDCRQYPGFNILRHRISPDSHVTLFVVPSWQSDYSYDNHVAVTVPRGEDAIQGLYQAFTSTSGTPRPWPSPGTD